MKQLLFLALVLTTSCAYGQLTFEEYDDNNNLIDSTVTQSYRIYKIVNNDYIHLKEYNQYDSLTIDVTLVIMEKTTARNNTSYWVQNLKDEEYAISFADSSVGFKGVIYTYEDGYKALIRGNVTYYSVTSEY